MWRIKLCALSLLVPGSLQLDLLLAFSELPRRFTVYVTRVASFSRCYFSYATTFFFLRRPIGGDLSVLVARPSTPMPAAKLYSSEKKAEGVNNSMEPFFPYSTTDIGVEWFQLRRAFDQPDVPGWPLLTPMKIQMQKCEKCSLEFCSPVNYRMHFQVHCRSLAVKKGPHDLRNKLAAFWNKLSVEQAKEALSFSDVTVKDIPASSIVITMASSLRNPGFWALPRAYFKAGVSLLNIIQGKDLGPLVSSQELFNILDDASEKPFLCAGIAESIQTYIFYGETAKIVLEMKNLIASVSFIF